MPLIAADGAEICAECTVLCLPCTRACLLADGPDLGGTIDSGADGIDTT
jgi:hypothetical protein